MEINEKIAAGHARARGQPRLAQNGAGLGTVLESGTEEIGGSRSGMSNLLKACRIPYRPRSKNSTARIVSSVHREEKQDRRRLCRHQRLKLDQRGGEGVDEHVDHRRRSGEPSRRRFLRAHQMLGASMESNFRIAVSG